MDDLIKILVAEDEEGIRALLFDALSSQGFSVTLAKDGKESLDRMQQGHFDLLITDLNMPRLNGIELLKKMKAAGRKEKIIIMTGTPIDHESLGAEIPPVSTQLHKPVSLIHFFEAVSTALSRPESMEAFARPN